MLLWMLQLRAVHVVSFPSNPTVFFSCLLPRMLEYLRKDVFNLKARNYLLRNDLDELKTCSQQLEEHNRTLTASLDAQRQQTARLSNSNVHLVAEIKAQKESITNLTKEVVAKKFEHLTELAGLKEEQRKREAALKAEISRLSKELEDTKKRPPVPKPKPLQRNADRKPATGKITPKNTKSSSGFRRINSVSTFDSFATSNGESGLRRIQSIKSFDSCATNNSETASMRSGVSGSFKASATRTAKNVGSSPIPHWRRHHGSRGSPLKINTKKKNQSEKSPSSTSSSPKTSLGAALISSNTESPKPAAESSLSKAVNSSSLSKALSSSKTQSNRG